MASIQPIKSSLTGRTSYRAQVRVKGRAAESCTFPTKKEAQDWATSLEAAIREGRHFPHAAARRTDFTALIEDYERTVLPNFERQRTGKPQASAGMVGGHSLKATHWPRLRPTRYRRPEMCWPRRPTAVGKPRTLRSGKVIEPKTYQLSGATVNRYLATLSHCLSFAVKERRLIDRNPVSDISRKKEPRGAYTLSVG